MAKEMNITGLTGLLVLVWGVGLVFLVLFSI